MAVWLHINKADFLWLRIYLAPLYIPVRSPVTEFISLRPHVTVVRYRYYCPKDHLMRPLQY